MDQWKKQGVLVLVICMLLSAPYPGWLSSVGTAHAAVSFVGDGSEDRPFQITTAEQLNEIRNLQSSHFILMNDVDLSTDASTITWEPITNFSGSLDGNEKTITNLNIQKNSNNVGLFANVLTGGHIENLFIDAVEVRGWNHVGILVGQNTGATVHNVSVSGAVYGDNYVGGLIGRSFESNVSNSSASGDVWGASSVGGLVGDYITGTINESYATGSVAASSRDGGGLVGYLQDGDVILSYATGEVTGLKNTGGLIGESVRSSVTYSYATGNVAGNVDAGGLIGGNRTSDISFSFATGNVSGCDDIGGLVGDNDQGKISDSYATVNLTGTCNPGSDSIGGLIGDNSGTIERSFAKGSITGHIARVGGLVGDNRYIEGNITNSFYDMELSGQSDNKGQGLTSEQMKNIENYDGWDFDTIWRVDQHHYGYPYLVGMQGMQAFLTYMGNDSNDDSGLYVSKPYRIGSSVTIEDFNWTRRGHLFQGWNTESTGSGIPYEIGDTGPLNSNLLLYATWKRVSSGSGSWQSDNANLANLIVTVDGEELALSPEFPAAETSYRAETMSSEAMIEATPSGAGATVTLEGEGLNGGKTVVLAEGDNVFEIVVKAESGTLKTYRLTIHRRVAETGGASTTPEAPGCIFSDVTGHWAASFICEAFERGIVNGHTETRFSPQSGVTRVEFVAILLRTLDMTSSVSSLTGHGFVDQDQIPAWATSTVHIAVENGLLQGYPDHSLRPLDNVSRAEMVTIIGRAMEWENLLGNTTFHDDAGIPHWAKGYIQEAVARGLLKGRAGNRFSPSEPATRAEAAVLLLKLWYVLDELNSESGD